MTKNETSPLFWAIVPCYKLLRIWIVFFIYSVGLRCPSKILYLNFDSQDSLCSEVQSNKGNKIIA